MTNDVLQLVADAGKGSYEKFQQLNELNYKTLEKLTELQLGLFSLNVENAVQQAKVLSELDDYANLLTLETEVANGYRDKLTTLTQEAGEFLTQSRDQYVNLVGQYFSMEQEKPQGTSATVQKKQTTKKRRPVKKAA